MAPFSLDDSTLRHLQQEYPETTTSEDDALATIQASRALPRHHPLSSVSATETNTTKPGTAHHSPIESAPSTSPSHPRRTRYSFRETVTVWLSHLTALAMLVTALCGVDESAAAWTCSDGVKYGLLSWTASASVSAGGMPYTADVSHEYKGDQCKHMGRSIDPNVSDLSDICDNCELYGTASLCFTIVALIGTLVSITHLVYMLGADSDCFRTRVSVAMIAVILSGASAAGMWFGCFLELQDLSDISTMDAPRLDIGWFAVVIAVVVAGLAIVSNCLGVCLAEGASPQEEKEAENLEV